jgi:imidazolonepropionase
LTVTLYSGIKQLATMQGGPSGPLCGKAMRTAQVICDGAIAVKDGRLVAVGERPDVEAALPADVNRVDVGGRLVTPGLVDPHTHVVYAGSRASELEQKLNGVPYLDVLAAGGGILSTVEQTRASSLEELIAAAKGRLETMLAYGVTCVEAKSGYGLDWATEERQMLAVRELAQRGPQRLVSTFLGAHAMAPEFREHPSAFVDAVVGMMARVAEQGLAAYADVFCETGVFSVEDSRRILQAAQAVGLGVKIHADEINPLGGAALAAELGAASADHLCAAATGDLIKMAEAGVLAVLLPATTWYLGKEMAPARRMIDECGLAVALATDCNPGSSPTENLQLVMQFAAHQMRMTPIEVLAAVTRNAAYAIGCGAVSGQLEVGRPADFVIWDVPDVSHLVYHFGTNQAAEVYIDGRLVAKRGCVL